MVEETKPVTRTTKVKADGEDYLAKFLSASGYKATDVEAHNNRTRVFVTSNGGKYQLMKSGNVRRLSGPAYPKESSEE